MPHKNLPERRNKPNSKQTEIANAHYIGAAILLAAAAGFLALVFALDRALDLGRFAY